MNCFCNKPAKLIFFCDETYIKCDICKYFANVKNKNCLECDYKMLVDVCHNMNCDRSPYKYMEYNLKKSKSE